eukprot:TRINITY_DN8232_c0_g1_i1.p1 TRINITY_DN8232_c0_g1~~TRINITY_DN8232_c0_g1_i1.p1  ORF type:complete len:345 (-),score=85.47 TRINITY_DN8232_c0_g1_i1:113-1147(-)
MKLHRGFISSVLLLVLLWFVCATVVVQAKEKPFHMPRAISLARAKTLAAMTDIDRIMEDTKQIAVVRVPDTEQHTRVRRYIVSQLNSAGWKVEEDAFVDNTPMGKKTFTNIIATLPPSGSPSPHKSIVIAAHYDSKYFKGFEFVAATDSAVPCALLLDIARWLPPLISSGQQQLKMGVQLIFFDGEEAFKDWTSTDSLYGSRHLAESWAATPSNSDHKKTKIEEIELLVLLDLMGASNPSFYDFPELNTSPLFRRLISIEESLQTRVLGTDEGKRFFKQQQIRSGIEDDHKPFLSRGVKCLHLIAYPFPSVWHTAKDNLAAIDSSAVAHISRVLRQFIVEYLHI